MFDGTWVLFVLLDKQGLLLGVCGTRISIDRRRVFFTHLIDRDECNDFVVFTRHFNVGPSAEIICACFHYSRDTVPEYATHGATGLIHRVEFSGCVGPYGLGMFDRLSDCLMSRVLDAVLRKIKIVFGAADKVSFDAGGYRKELGNIAALLVYSEAVRVKAIEAEDVLRFWRLHGVSPCNDGAEILSGEVSGLAVLV
jgi:hypothetical protein